MPDTTGTARAVFYKAQRRVLEAKRVELLRKTGVSVVRTAAEARGAPVTEDLERATAHGEQELAMTRLNGNLDTYNDVVAALQRIDDGKYGACERCGESIPVARLRAIAEARYCVSCQGIIESESGRRAPSRIPAGRESGRV